MIVSASSLSIAFAIGLYYAFLDSPLLFPIGIAESFFLFAYNLELFNGKFHNIVVFVVSWGILPVFAGSAIQINTISPETFALSGIAATLSFVLIKTSRRYKKLVQESDGIPATHREEIILKLVSNGVIAVTIFCLVLRYA